MPKKIDKIISFKDLVDKKTVSKKSENQKINSDKKIYQLKISLKHSKPSIYRRILIPDSITLLTLHDIIQTVMGWDDSHLHHFLINKEYYAPKEAEIEETNDSSKIMLKKFKFKEKQKFIYEYDFGDSWEHEISIEKILPYDPTKKYPVCIKGAMACPQEDCGGIWGYAELLEQISDPENEEYEEMLEWVGDDFNPKEFDIDTVNKILAKIRV